MIIKHPEAEHIPLLRGLWKEAFGDPDAYLDDFFCIAFSPDRCLTVWEEDRLAAALYWLDCSCRGQKCAYLYAVATAKAFRGRGLCHGLMARTHELLGQQGYAMAVLVPGSESLFRLYASMGYTVFGGIEERFHIASEAALFLRQIPAEEYAALRRRLLPEGGILQEGATLEFLKTQVRFFAGDGFCLCARIEGDTLFVPELLGQADPGSILKALSCREGTFRIPGSKPFAMWLPLRQAQKPEYFSFALD